MSRYNIRSSNRRLASRKLSLSETTHTLTLTSINLIARGTYFLVFLLIGNLYGATGVTDTVFLLYAPIAVAVTVIAGIAEIVYMPAAHRAEKLHCTQAFQRHLFQKAIVTVSILSPLFALVSFIVAGEINLLVVLLIPIPVLATTSAIHAGAFNAAGKFRTAALGPVYGALCAATAIWLLPRSAAGLAGTLLVYEIGRAASMYIHAARIPLPHEDPRDHNVEQLLSWAIRGIWLQALGSLLVALNPVVDMLFARTLGHGAVSSVEYANRLWIIIPLLFSGALMMTHSRFSRAASHAVLDHRQVHSRALQLGLLAAFAGLLIAFAANLWFMDWLYGWGQMDSATREAVATLLAAYLIGAGPYIASLVYIRALSAVGMVGHITQAAAVSLVVNAILDWALIGPLGLMGLGLATTISYLAVTVYLYLSLHRASATVDEKVQ
jgi:peptidoglycan biosynthesis protein MviN/MurJ (putative lipid II flippase)